MAGIDLGKYNIGISQNVGTPDLRSPPEGSIYKELENLGGTIADTSLNLYAKNRKQEVTEDAYRAYDDTRVKFTQFESDWKAQMVNGQSTINGKTYEDATKEFFESQDQKLKSSFKDDYEKYEAFSSLSREYQTSQKMKSVLDGNEFRVKANRFNSAEATKNQHDDWVNYVGDDFIDKVGIESKLEAQKKYDLGFNAYGPSEADAERKKYLHDSALIVNQKIKDVMTVNGEALNTVLGKYVPLDSFYDSTKGRYLFKFLKEGSYESPQELVEIKRTILEKGRELMSSLRATMSTNSVKDMELAQKVEAKIIAADKALGSDVIQMEELDIEGIFADDYSPEEKAALARSQPKSSDAFNVWEALTPTEKQQFMYDIMKQKYQTDKVDRSAFNLEISNLTKNAGLPENIKLFGTTEKSVDLSLDRLKAMRLNPTTGKMMDDYLWADKAYQIGVNKAMLETIRNPLYAGATANQLRDKWDQIGRAHILDVLGADNQKAQVWANQPWTGAAASSDAYKSSMSTYFRMRGQVLRNPEAAALTYSPNMQAMANSIVKADGSFGTQKDFDKFNKTYDAYLRMYAMPGTQTGEKFIGAIGENFANGINKARMQGGQAVNEYIGKFTSQLSPDLQGKLVDYSTRKGFIAPAEADTLLVSSLGGLSKDPSLSPLMSNLSYANTEASIKKNAEVFKGREEDLKDLKDSIMSDVNSFYGKSASTQAIPKAIINTLYNATLEEWSKDTSRNPKDLVATQLKTILAERVTPVESNYVRGVFKKNVDIDDDTDNIEDQAKSSITQLKSEIMSGKLKVDYSKIPGWNKATSRHKFFGKNRDAEVFLDSYTMKGTSVDDAGSSRSMDIIVEDRNGSKTYLPIQGRSTVTRIPLK